MDVKIPKFTHEFAAVDVWAEHFLDYSFGSISEGLGKYFDDDPNISTFDIVFHFMNSRHIDGISVTFSHDRATAIGIVVDGGIPYTTEQARVIAETAFTRVSASLEEISYYDGDITSGWSLDFGINDTDVRIGEVLKCWESLRAGLCVYRGDTGPDRRLEIINKITDGEFLDLIGEAESSSVEFKSRLNLREVREKEKLTKFVSAFANADRSAALIIGYQTEKINGRDTVTEFTPVRASEHSPEAYRQIIDSHVRPIIRGLGVSSIAVDPEQVVIIVTIPAQREIDKPFIREFTVGSGSQKRTIRSYFVKREDGIVELPENEIHPASPSTV